MSGMVFLTGGGGGEGEGFDPTGALLLDKDVNADNFVRLVATNDDGGDHL